MTVYVVEHGDYSDSHVVAVTDDETKADAIAAMDDSGRVTAYTLNEIADRLLQGYSAWSVEFLANTLKCLGVAKDWNECDLTPAEPTTASWPNPPSKGRDVTTHTVAARNKAEAIKIASEKQAQLVALGQYSEFGGQAFRKA